MPTLPLTQIDNRTLASDLDDRTLTLTFAQEVPLKDLLAELVRGTGLSIVLEPAVTGSFIGQLKDVTVRQALDSILRPLGMDYAVNHNVVHVFNREAETRIFDINLIAIERVGQTSIGSGSASLSSTTTGDLFSELANGVRTLLSDHGAYNVDRKAGLLQVTDSPERLERVAAYLDTVHDRAHRETVIDARILEVELDDDKASGIDWAAVARGPTSDSASTATGASVSPAPSTPSTGTTSSGTAMTRLRVGDLSKVLAALADQGKVTLVAHPHLVTLNNEPAIIRTEALTFSVTPQIASDSIITLSVSPILKAPSVAETDVIARVSNGETLVVSGFTRDREVRERKAVGISGGWFGRSTVVTRHRVELIILITPKISPSAVVE
jgi:type II secretory pathway component GspD/PulD (secretin)